MLNVYTWPVSYAQSHEEQPPPEQRYEVSPSDYRIHSLDGDSQKNVLLTFDDGPMGESTKQLLDVLDRHHAKSIWFVNGFRLAEKKQDGTYVIKPEKAALLQEIVKRGHLIGNHTWWHANLRKLPEEQQREEIESTSKVIAEIIGEPPRYFRPPFGASTEASDRISRELGMQPMNWSVGSLDWDPHVYKVPGAITKQVLSTIHDGANILFHDRSWTAAELDQTLSALAHLGFHFVLPTEVR